MYVRETKFGFVPQHFDKIVEWADAAKERMKETEGLHSIALFKISEDHGKILAMYKTQKHMDKGKGLFFMALTGVLPWITLSPDVEEYEVNWMWERNQGQGKRHG